MYNSRTIVGSLTNFILENGLRVGIGCLNLSPAIFRHVLGTRQHHFSSYFAENPCYHLDGRNG
jgi:hypothetical protein